jgi:nucleoside-diphosphate-sugar epimerase
MRPPRDDAELDDLLSHPSPDDVAAAARVPGDVLVLGAGGKMGPSLARLIRRACHVAEDGRTVTAVSRFHDARAREGLDTHGVRTMAADLLAPGALEALPDAPNVVFMAGQKFGTSDDPASTWALNALLPGLVLRRFRDARVVVFSTGNVYPLMPAPSRGAREDDPTGPVGEYAQSALARERIVSHLSQAQSTPAALLRLNYAVELRYGVLRDLVERVAARDPVDLTTGWVNVIWQRDANSVAWRALDACAVPPYVVNLTGGAPLAVRALVEAIAARLDVDPVVVGEEADSALLSDASRCVERFGPPSMTVETMLDWVVAWWRQGGRSLGKPTRFDARDGAF